MEKYSPFVQDLARRRMERARACEIRWKNTAHLFKILQEEEWRELGIGNQEIKR